MRKHNNVNGLLIILLVAVAALSAGCSEEEVDPACLKQCQDNLDFCNTSCAMTRQMCEDASGSGCQAAYEQCVSDCENSYDVCENSCKRLSYSSNLIGPGPAGSSAYKCEKMYYRQ